MDQRGKFKPCGRKPDEGRMDRRRFLGIAAAGTSALYLQGRAEAASAAASGLASHNPQSPVQVKHLTCEFMIDPLGIDAAKPQLGWQLASNEPGAGQSAYQILVAENSEVLAGGDGDLWNTGKVSSDNSVSVAYGGRPLRSGERCYWKVRIWDQHGIPTRWSAVSVWEMGLLDVSDWRAQWIGAAAHESADSFDTPPAPYCRTTFEIDKPLKSARAYICGLGYYELFLNGAKVGDQVLAPAQTDYSRRHLSHLLYPVRDSGMKRVLYNTHDITSLLHSGRNAVGVILGNGWYNQRARRVEGWMWYGQPRLILQIRLNFSDGTSALVLSTPQWKINTGPILQDAIFTGETYDARKEVPEWCRPDFDDSAWSPAHTVAAPTGTLMAQMAPHDRVVDDLTATELTHPVRGIEGAIFDPRPGVYGFDFGRNFAGWVRLKVRQPRGTKIRVDYIEDSGLRYGQSDTYIAKGVGEEVYEPRFTWHGFRYIEVQGCVTPPVAKAITGRSAHTDVKDAGDFECSNPLLNQLYANYRRTEHAALHGAVPMDCPHRERLGYGADGHLSAQSAIYCFDMPRLYSKWAGDLAGAQGPRSGFVPHTAPFEGGGGGPAWGAACVLIPWYVYLYYGDRRVLHQHYETMKRWVAFLESCTNAAGIITHEEPGGWCLGDWATPSPIAIPPELVNTCYLAHLCDLMARIAAIIRRPEDISAYRGYFAKAKRAVNKAFFNHANGYYSIGRQGADVFPLAFGLVPPAAKHRVFDHLVTHLERRTRGHFDTGILATPLMLDVLTGHGRADLALTLMSQTTFPSYGWQIARGATTLWENWNGMGSHIHPMFGSVCRWFFRDLAGIQPDWRAPGFRTVMIKPQPVKRLAWVRAEHAGPYGIIKSSWRWHGRQLVLDIVIPPASSGRMMLPGAAHQIVRCNGRTLSSRVEGIRGIKREVAETGSLALHAAAGSYHLVYTPQGAA